MRCVAIVLLVLSSAAQAAPDCVPGLYGKAWPGTTRHIVEGQHGKYAFAWCDIGVGLPAPQYRMCALSECPATPIDAQAALARRPDYRCDIFPPGASAVPPFPLPVPAPDTPRGLACAELLSLMHAAWPQPAVMRVKRNPQATDGSRPVLELRADGTIGKTLSGRAAAGVTCDAALPTRRSTGSDVYATPEGRVAGEVAICELVP